MAGQVHGVSPLFTYLNTMIEASRSLIFATTQSVTTGSITRLKPLRLTSHAMAALQDHIAITKLNVSFPDPNTTNKKKKSIFFTLRES